MYSHIHLKQGTYQFTYKYLPPYLAEKINMPFVDIYIF